MHQCRIGRLIVTLRRRANRRSNSSGSPKMLSPILPHASRTPNPPPPTPPPPQKTAPPPLLIPPPPLFLLPPKNILFLVAGFVGVAPFFGGGGGGKKPFGYSVFLWGGFSLVYPPFLY